MSVTIDGIRLDDIGVRVLAGSNVPIAPPTRDRLVAVPGRHGAYDFGSDFDVRTFELDCAIMRQPSAIALQRKAREIVTLLTDGTGRPKEVRLEFDDEPDRYYTVKLTGALPLERIARLGKFTMVLRAADPFAYADSTYKQDGVITGINYDEGRFYPADPNEITMDSTVYTVSDPVSFNEAYEPNYFYENPTAFTWSYSKHYNGVYNYSLYNTPLVIDITGDVINPRITNQTTGKTLYLPTIAGGQKMTVDTGKFTVKVNGASKLTGVKGIEDFTLASGDNSLLFEGGLPSAAVTFKWKHKFM